MAVPDRFPLESEILCILMDSYCFYHPVAVIGMNDGFEHWMAHGDLGRKSIQIRRLLSSAGGQQTV
jgi:hypothetical protein